MAKDEMSELGAGRAKCEMSERSEFSSWQSLAGAYPNEKPCSLKFPIIEYGIVYSIRHKIPKNFNELKVGEYFRGYCEIRPYHAFSGKTKGITFTLNKVIR